MPLSTAQWRKLSLILLLLAPSPVAWSVNDLDLWLPASLRDLTPQLRKAALAVEATEACEKVMQGGLYEPSRKEETPLFRMLCRDHQRHSFAVLVNSKTLDMTFPGRKTDVKDFSQKMIKATWRVCQEKLKKKTKFMHKMKVITQGMPEPDTSEKGTVKMVIDFDAETLQHKPLYYRATCFATYEQPATLTIQGRPKS